MMKRKMNLYKRKANLRVKKQMNRKELPIFSILSLCISLFAVLLSFSTLILFSKQIEIEDMERYPKFTIRKMEDVSAYHLYNAGGYISNVNFRIYDVLEIKTESYLAHAYINYTPNETTISTDTETDWYRQSMMEERDYKENFKIKLKNVEMKVTDDIRLQRYFRIDYVDFENEHHTEYYMEDHNEEITYDRNIGNNLYCSSAWYYNLPILNEGFYISFDNDFENSLNHLANLLNDRFDLKYKSYQLHGRTTDCEDYDSRSFE